MASQPMETRAQGARAGLAARLLAALRREGHYVDYWTIVHVLTGLLLGTACDLLGVGGLTAALIAAAFLAGWEVVEPPLYRRYGKYFPYGLGRGSRFPETRANQIVDAVVGVLGFAVGYLI